MTEEQYIISKEIYLNNKGKSISWVAEQSGVNRKILAKRLKDDGLYRGKGYTKEFLIKASNMIKNGKGITAVSKELEVDRFALSRALVDAGLYDAKNKYDLSKYETSDMLNMIEDYKNKMNKFDIMKKYNISERFMYNVLRHHKIERKNNKKYSLNENIFDVIDTESKAYWLGFLYADGYVNEKQNIVELTLSEVDYDHICKFKEFLETDVPIRERNSTIKGKEFKSYRIAVYSPQLVKKLSTHGCIQNKSLKLEFPEFLPNELVHHFIRGYFDGDGCITSHSGQIGFSLIGTESFLDSCIEKMDLHHNKKNMCGKAYEIRYHGNNLAKKIYNYLFKDATIYLSRKRMKLTAVLS